jgi:hypothetical protein
MKTSKEVRTALVDTLKVIKVANGYQNDLPDTHIHDTYTREIVDSEKDDLYPKVFVVMQRGVNTRLPSGNEQKILDFVIIFVGKKLATGDDIDAIVTAYLQDLEKAIFDNDTLGGAVQDVSVVEFATDGGVCSPEGVILLHVRTERYRHGNP